MEDDYKTPEQRTCLLKFYPLHMLAGDFYRLISFLNVVCMTGV